jgi:hypothetical protein
MVIGEVFQPRSKLRGIRLNQRIFLKTFVGIEQFIMIPQLTEEA